MHHRLVLVLGRHAALHELLAAARGDGRASSTSSIPSHRPHRRTSHTAALTMVAAVELTLRLPYVLADATGLAGPLSDRSPTVLALRPIGITLGSLACVLAAAKAMQLIATIRTRGRHPSRRFAHLVAAPACSASLAL